MMLTVLGVNHASSPAQTGELGLTTVSIRKMWQFIVLAIRVCLVLTAAVVQAVSLGYINLITWMGGQYGKVWYESATPCHIILPSK